MDTDEPILYSLDDDTKELLTELLHLVEGLADLQMTEESTAEMRLLNRMVGERFGIEFSEIVLESDKDSDGNPRFTVKTYRDPSATNNRPNLKLVYDKDNPSKVSEDGVTNNNDNEPG